MTIPMFGFVLLSFLLLAVVLAVAVFFAFRSGESGHTKVSGPAGCLIAFALLLIAGVGAAGLFVVALIRVPTEAVRHGPLESIEWRWDKEAGATVPADGSEGSEGRNSRGMQGTLRVTAELRGTQDPSDVMKWLRRRTDAETHIAVREERDEVGEMVTIVELTLPPDHDVARELRQMRRELERDLPDLNLPSGVKVTFRGPDE